MAIKKVRVEALVTIWSEIEVDEDEHIEEAVHRWGKHYDDDVWFDEIKFIEVVEEIE
jgi:hypothetical protein